MSRLNGAISLRHATGTNGIAEPPPVDTQDETCPVCKTTRYFNRDMEFRINPECYHRMCRTCVDRIFKDGPAQCPYAGCHKTLRLRGFKSAFFADLSVEREVDIRRRVAQVFNQAEEDFEDLDGYNAYLEMVEDLTNDLVSGSEDARRRREAQLQDYEAQHKAEIERNRKLARETDDTRRAKLEAEQNAARARRLQDFEDERAEKTNAARFKEEMLDSLQSAEAGQGTQAFDKVMLKKRGQQKSSAALQASAAEQLSIRGLREKKRVVVEEGPYDPYGGLDLAPQRINLSNLDGYRNDWIDRARMREEYKTGGYNADEYVGRALFEAFAGLGISMEEDKGEKAVSTMGAAQVVAETS